MDINNQQPVSSDRLQQAYAALMERAPSALFRKARQLYLNKYCLDGREPQGPCVFTCNRRRPRSALNPACGARASSLSDLHRAAHHLALVHWQQPEAADPAKQAAYLQHWGLDGIALQPQSESWFREGGHHALLPAPSDLLWRKESLLPELSRELD